MILKVLRRIILTILLILFYLLNIFTLFTNNFDQKVINRTIVFHLRHYHLSYQDWLIDNIKFKIDYVYKKPSKTVKYFNVFNKKKEYLIVVYKEEEIINNKKYTDYATYIRDSENRYYAVDGKIFCLGIPCIDN